MEAGLQHALEWKPGGSSQKRVLRTTLPFELIQKTLTIDVAPFEQALGSITCVATLAQFHYMVAGTDHGRLLLFDISGPRKANSYEYLHVVLRSPYNRIDAVTRINISCRGSSFILHVVYRSGCYQAVRVSLVNPQKSVQNNSGPITSVGTTLLGAANLLGTGLLGSGAAGTTVGGSTMIGDMASQFWNTLKKTDLLDSGGTRRYHQSDSPILWESPECPVSCAPVELVDGLNNQLSSSALTSGSSLTSSIKPIVDVWSHDDDILFQDKSGWLYSHQLQASVVPLGFWSGEIRVTQYNGTELMWLSKNQLIFGRVLSSSISPRNVQLQPLLEVSPSHTLLFNESESEEKLVGPIEALLVPKVASPKTSGVGAPWHAIRLQNNLCLVAYERNLWYVRIQGVQIEVFAHVQLSAQHTVKQLHPLYRAGCSFVSITHEGTSSLYLFDWRVLLDVNVINYYKLCIEPTDGTVSSCTRADYSYASTDLVNIIVSVMKNKQVTCYVFNGWSAVMKSSLNHLLQFSPSLIDTYRLTRWIIMCASYEIPTFGRIDSLRSLAAQLIQEVWLGHLESICNQTSMEDFSTTIIEALEEQAALEGGETFLIDDPTLMAQIVDDDEECVSPSNASPRSGARLSEMALMKRMVAIASIIVDLLTKSDNAPLLPQILSLRLVNRGRLISSAFAMAVEQHVLKSLPGILTTSTEALSQKHSVKEELYKVYRLVELIPVSLVHTYFLTYMKFLNMRPLPSTIRQIIELPSPPRIDIQQREDIMSPPSPDDNARSLAGTHAEAMLASPKSLQLLPSATRSVDGCRLCRWRIAVRPNALYTCLSSAGRSACGVCLHRFNLVMAVLGRCEQFRDLQSACIPPNWAWNLVDPLVKPHVTFDDISFWTQQAMQVRHFFISRFQQAPSEESPSKADQAHEQTAINQRASDHRLPVPAPPSRSSSYESSVFSKEAKLAGSVTARQRALSEDLHDLFMNHEEQEEAEGNVSAPLPLEDPVVSAPEEAQETEIMVETEITGVMNIGTLIDEMDPYSPEDRKPSGSKPITVGKPSHKAWFWLRVQLLAQHVLEGWNLPPDSDNAWFDCPARGLMPSSPLVLFAAIERWLSLTDIRLVEDTLISADNALLEFFAISPVLTVKSFILKLVKGALPRILLQQICTALDRYASQAETWPEICLVQFIRFQVLIFMIANHRYDANEDERVPLIQAILSPQHEVYTQLVRVASSSVTEMDPTDVLPLTREEILNLGHDEGNPLLDHRIAVTLLGKLEWPGFNEICEEALLILVAQLKASGRPPAETQPRLDANAVAACIALGYRNAAIQIADLVQLYEKALDLMQPGEVYSYIVQQNSEDEDAEQTRRKRQAYWDWCVRNYRLLKQDLRYIGLAIRLMGDADPVQLLDMFLAVDDHEIRLIWLGLLWRLICLPEANEAFMCARCIPTTAAPQEFMVYSNVVVKALMQDHKTELSSPSSEVLEHTDWPLKKLAAVNLLRSRLPELLSCTVPASVNLLRPPTAKCALSTPNNSVPSTAPALETSFSCSHLPGLTMKPHASNPHMHHLTPACMLLMVRLGNIHLKISLTDFDDRVILTEGSIHRLLFKLEILRLRGGTQEVASFLSNCVPHVFSHPDLREPQLVAAAGMTAARDVWPGITELSCAKFICAVIKDTPGSELASLSVLHQKYGQNPAWFGRIYDAIEGIAGVRLQVPFKTDSAATALRKAWMDAQIASCQNRLLGLLDGDDEEKLGATPNHSTLFVDSNQINLGDCKACGETLNFVDRPNVSKFIGEARWQDLRKALSVLELDTHGRAWHRDCYRLDVDWVLDS